MARRYRSGPVASTHLALLYTEFQIPGGWGVTGGPPMVMLKRPPGRPAGCVAFVSGSATYLARREV